MAKRKAASSDFGLLPAVERARQSEKQIHDLLQAAITKGNPDIIAQYQRLHQQALDTLRKAEKDLPGIQRDTADLVPLAEAGKELELMAAEIRTLLLSLPRSIAPRLENRKAAEVEATLQAELDGILKVLSRG